MQATPRKLTWEEAEQLRAMRESFGTSFENLARIFNVGKTTARTICADDSYKTPTAWVEQNDYEPTPHDQIRADVWHAGESWDVDLPSVSITPSISNRLSEAAAARYSAANERDGYLHDPQYIAAVQQWKSGDLPDALPMAAD